jgi:hypothetical protein
VNRPSALIHFAAACTYGDKTDRAEKRSIFTHGTLQDGTKVPFTMIALEPHFKRKIGERFESEKKQPIAQLIERG